MNSLQGGELVVFDLMVRMDQQSAELEHLDLMRVRKMPSFGYGLTGGSDFGWNVQLSYDRNVTDELTPKIKGGLFDGIKHGHSQYLIGTDVQAQPNEEGDWFIEPYLSWHYSQTKFQSKMTLGASYDIETENAAQNHELDISYFFSTKFAINLNVHYRETATGLLSLNIYK